MCVCVCVCVFALIIIGDTNHVFSALRCIAICGLSGCTILSHKAARISGKITERNKRVLIVSASFV